MKLVVVAKTHQVLQQALLVDGGPAVTDLQAAPVGLAGHQAVALEQAAGQHLGDWRLVGCCAQQLRRRRVLAALDVKPVQAQAVELLHRLAVEQFGVEQPHAHRRLHYSAAPGRLVQVCTQVRQHGSGISKHRVVEAVEVELERLALDDVGRFAGHGDVRQRHLRFAAWPKPAELKSSPNISAQKRQRSRQPEFGALGLAGDRVQK